VSHDGKDSLDNYYHISTPYFSGALVFALFEYIQTPQKPNVWALENGKMSSMKSPVADSMSYEGTKDSYTHIPTTCFSKKIKKRKHVWNLKYRND
jgi:hypothetical protein